MRSIEDLPGPSRLPLLGNAHQVRISRLHSIAERWCERYGPVFRFDLGRRRIVCIAELETINTILRNRPEGFRRWREVKERSEETGMSGVFVAEGDEWRRQRRLAVTALNSNHLSRYFHIVRTSTERLYRRLKEESLRGRPFDIGQELASYTVDITSALAFGHDLNTLERRNNQSIQLVFFMRKRKRDANLERCFVSSEGGTSGSTIEAPAAGRKQNSCLGVGVGPGPASESFAEVWRRFVRFDSFRRRLSSVARFGWTGISIRAHP